MEARISSMDWFPCAFAAWVIAAFRVPLRFCTGLTVIRGRETRESLATITIVACKWEYRMAKTEYKTRHVDTSTCRLCSAEQRRLFFRRASERRSSCRGSAGSAPSDRRAEPAGRAPESTSGRPMTAAYRTPPRDRVARVTKATRAFTSSCCAFSTSSVVRWPTRASSRTPLSAISAAATCALVASICALAASSWPQGLHHIGARLIAVEREFKTPLADGFLGLPDQ